MLTKYASYQPKVLWSVKTLTGGKACVAMASFDLKWKKMSYLWQIILSCERWWIKQTKKTRMHSSRMPTDRYRRCTGPSLTEPQTDNPWAETTNRDPQTETARDRDFWIETPLDRDPPGQRPTRTCGTPKPETPPRTETPFQDRYTSRTETPLPPVNRQTWVKTLAFHNFFAGGNNQNIFPWYELTAKEISISVALSGLLYCLVLFGSLPLTIINTRMLWFNSAAWQKEVQKLQCII